MELAHDLGPLLVLWDPLRAGQIPHINGKVPRKRRAALGPAGFRLDDGLGQTVAGISFIGTNMGISERLETQGVA
jgi:hypothetical protein